jgi:NAD(P)-dependent dehydrogenase (short-subunit alcohol dehydrogenase family)
MDGTFGFGSLFRNQSSGDNGSDVPFSNPVSGGLAGLAKTAAKEWPEVQCKALDVASDWGDTEAAASAILDEMLTAAAVEVGISARGKCGIQLEETAVTPSTGHSPFTRDDVVLLSGGARGITAEVAVALAQTFSPTLALLGRSPEPKPEPDWLENLTDEGHIKQAMLSHSDRKTSPKEIEEQYHQKMAQREILRNLQRIKTAGSDVVYRSVDIRDPEAVRKVVAEIRNRYGPICGLIHGAGVIADRRIENKTLEQFDRVYATKVQGLRNLLQFLDADDLRVLVLFSSSTARFGRAGQVDYAVANEVLNKLAQQEARRRPTCRVVSVNWGPWEGGMVTSSVRKVFESEGVGLIPLQAGAEYLVRELSQNSERAVEVVVRGAKGSPEELKDGNGQISNKQTVTAHYAPLSTHQPPFTLAFEQELDVEHFPFMKSHVIDGHAVLPLAIMLEWLAHGALHANPGLIFHGCDELRVLKGVILKDDEPYPLGVLTGKAMREGPYYRVPVEMLSGLRQTGSGDWQGRKVVHCRADIILAEKLPDANQKVPEMVTAPYLREKEEIYGELLFHGPDLQGIERVVGCSEKGIIGQVSVAPPPSAWIRRPLRNGWLADPLVIDCAFQLMVLWSFENHGSVSLPCFLGRYRQYRRSFPRGSVRVIAALKEAGAQRARADIVFQDGAGHVVARLENYECVIDAKLNEAFRRKRLIEETIPTT